ncbi:hypothetical protein QAD02_007778 [Eretmocerus hayati]|uniref:Uncharacterized protein n=1 Tax=Eretmocerus hayati TaxID=131215 RepID=A0ACC2N604_9HYME|nr:hypothetical protein QAD02_007778 [Eretmocerus hayati]
MGRWFSVTFCHARHFTISGAFSGFDYGYGSITSGGSGVDSAKYFLDGDILVLMASGIGVFSGGMKECATQFSTISFGIGSLPKYAGKEEVDLSRRLSEGSDPISANVT